MNHLALIGYPLQHSFSKRYFDEKFQSNGITNYDYSLLEIANLDGIKETIEKKHICGFNVTAPFKQQIIKHLDSISDDAQAIGAVNCVCVRNGKWHGYNTDWLAFMQTIIPWKNQVANALALILGSGGAARAVAHALEKLGIENTMVSRYPNKNKNTIGYSTANHLMETRHTLLINATPIGMHPYTSACPWPYADNLNKCILVYDLIYNPSQTQLLHIATSQNIPTHNGFDMLHLQADHGWELFQSVATPHKHIEEQSIKQQPLRENN